MTFELIMLFQIFIAAFIFGFSGAISPGPVLVAVIESTPKYGKFTGFLFIVGHSILEIIVIIAIFYNLAFFLMIPLIYFIFCTVGGGILFILGYLIIKNINEYSIEREFIKTDINESKLKHPIIQGMILSVSNPFFLIWWGTAGLSNILSLNVFIFGFLGALIYFLGHISSDFLWYDVISFSVHFGKKFIINKVYKILLIICCSLFFYFGFKFIFLGTSKFFFNMDFSNFFPF
ncbi:MAG: LysE family translocator [Candidatus Helarchaeota archaeon]